MKKINRKKIWFTALLIINLIPFYIPVKADDIPVNSFNILPELSEAEIQDIDEKIDEIWKEWWWVWNKYNEIAASEEFTTSKKLASWIMDWNTIIDYLKYIVKFLSQLGLFVWAAFIVYAWYVYMVSVFNWQKSWKDYLKNAIIWIIIVVFSYAIMKTLTSLVWIT